MLHALRRLRSLPPTARAILQKRGFEGSVTAAEALALLAPVAEFDRANDGARGKIGCLMVLLGAGLLFGVFIAAETLSMALAAVLAGVLLALLALGWLLRRLFVLDAANNLRDVALPWIAVLREDMAAEQPLRLRIDLSKATAAGKKQRSDPPYSRGKYYKVVDTHYRDPWFAGEARLLDGCRLRWQVVDELVESNRTKRNARNRHKTKVRYRKRSRVELQLSAPRKRYRCLADGAAPPAAAPDARRIHLRQQLKLKRRDDQPLDIDALLAGVAQLYRQLQPIARETRG